MCKCAPPGCSGNVQMFPSWLFRKCANVPLLVVQEMAFSSDGVIITLFIAVEAECV